MYQAAKPSPVHLVEVGDDVVSAGTEFKRPKKVVYQGTSYRAARQLFKEFKRASACGLGDDALTEVSWRCAGEPVKQHVPAY